CQQHNGDPPTF
nr:immunoglobulin light chain junction region [Macaca mulatta]